MSSLRRCVAALSLAVVILVSGVARADELPPESAEVSAPAPRRSVLPTVGTSIAIGGVATFATTWAASIFLGLMGEIVCAAGYQCHPSPAWLFVPVAGPFKIAHDSASGTTAWNIDGAVQAVGLGAVAIGAVVTALGRPVPAVRKGPAHASLHILPLAGAQPGLAFAGSF